PPKAPRAVSLLDVGRREIETFVDDELDRLPARIAAFDLIGAENVRTLTQSLGLNVEGKRLAELGPPQKSRKLNAAGRKLKITNALLTKGSCGISRPFGDPKKLRGYLAAGEETKLRRRLEADVKS